MTKRNDQMPTISMFYGIIVRMFAEKDGKHNMPHIHAKYGDFEGNIIEGKFPSKQLKMLTAWIAIHEDDLRANWELLIEGEPFYKIEPLK